MRHDLRLALRSRARNPGFAAAAILTLALGIGANTAIFSVVNAVLLRPAPFHELERLVMVWETDRNSSTTREPASVPDYLDYRAQSASLESLAALMAAQVNLSGASGDPVESRHCASLGICSRRSASIRSPDAGSAPKRTRSAPPTQPSSANRSPVRSPAR